MDNIVQHQARIGMVNYINTAPLYEVWLESVHNPAWKVVEAPPSVLNQLLYENRLDLGLVSSHEYAAHPTDYRILPDLSISATGPVGSVFLFSRRPPAELNDQTVLLSSQSQTSVSLVKIILEDFYRVTPRYFRGEVLEEAPLVEQAEAVLAIGDDALRLSREGRYPVRLDLGEVWRQETGLPFVFAVWAVRDEFCRDHAEELAMIHAELLRCVATGKDRLLDISSRVAPRIPMDPEACFHYLQALEYDLGPLKQGALARFYSYLIKRGEGEAGALPLRFFG